ncbi:MAG TPA: peptidase domain-containing ABC transporter [Myxococcales bacterium]|jgi:ABC-type bacteriocin/lantibiotic exporter with double-glycine peptidase domain
MTVNLPPSLASRFPALRRLAFASRKKAIPVIQQMTNAECGAASLAMILGYHGKHVPLDQLRAALGIARDGASALALLQVAEHHGLRGRGIALDIDDLEYLPAASVLHWSFGHFVVFERLYPGAVGVVDPALGRRVVPMAEFREAFTGIALLFEPGDGFSPQARPASLLGSYLRKALGHSRLLWRIVVASVMLQVFGLAIPVLTSSVVDRVVPRSDGHLLLLLGAGTAVLLALQMLAGLLRGELLLNLRTHLDAEMTVGFVEHLNGLPWAFFQQRTAGDLLQRLGSNSTVREMLSTAALSAMLDGPLIAIYLAILFAVSPQLGLVAAFLGALQLGLYLATSRRQRELMGATLSTLARASSFEVEMLTGMETLKAMGAESAAAAHWSNLFVDELNVSLDRGRLDARTEALAGTLRVGSPLILLAAGAAQVIHGDLTLGSMLAANALALGFLTPLASMMGSVTLLQRVGSYLERLEDVFATPPEQDQRVGLTRPDRLRGQIRLDDVTFRYAPHGRPAVHGVSVAIEPGQRVAVVGRSGAGKSTLAHLLLGLCLPESGRILFDGQDLRGLDLRHVRQRVGIVSQSPAIFTESVRANIALGDPTLSLDRVVEAARLAQLHDDICAMPLGYETVIADRGASLSGGQRQRLALARALARRPAILLLDEATSSLDSITEREVQRALESLRCTQIVIAHRLSTIRSADLILVMEDGRLVEAGTHNELLVKNGAYARLFWAQGDEAEAAAR